MRKKKHHYTSNLPYYNFFSFFFVSFFLASRLSTHTHDRPNTTTNNDGAGDNTYQCNATSVFRLKPSFPFFFSFLSF